MLASELYGKMVSVIDDAAERENIHSVPEAASAEGMTGGEISAGLSQRWEFSYSDPAGATVEVKCHWYDQSKAFSIRPDKHIMTVACGRLSHTRAYES